MTYLLIFLNVLATLLFLFFYWKRLRGDYTEEQIFGSGLLTLITTVTMSLISHFIYPNAWFWFASFGALVGLYISKKKFAVGFIESLEATFISFLPWLSIIYLYNFISKKNVICISLFAVVILVAVVFQLVDRNYKKFVWYKSGKVGIAGLVCIVLFFTLRLLIGIAAGGMLSFLGNYDIILSILTIIAGIIASYRLATQKNK